MTAPVVIRDEEHAIDILNAEVEEYLIRCDEARKQDEKRLWADTDADVIDIYPLWKRTPW